MVANKIDQESMDNKDVVEDTWRIVEAADELPIQQSCHVPL